MTTQDDAAKELEQALSTLTAEERAAYDEGQAEGDDTTATVEDTEAAAAAALESGDAKKPEEAAKPVPGSGADDNDGAAAAKPNDAASAAAAASAASEQAAAPAPAPTAQPAPAFVAEAPADAAEKLATIAADKAALASKFDAGDINVVEYQSSLDSLYKAERDIEKAVLKHEMATEMATQQKLAAWTAECTQFMADHPEYQVGTPVFDKLNGLVKALGMDGTRTDSQALALAHQMVQLEAGTYVAPAAAAAAAKKAPEQSPKPTLPPTLAGLPSAGAVNPGESRWSALDRLDGDAYEAAVAKLSQADRDAYMSA